MRYKSALLVGLLVAALLVGALSLPQQKVKAQGTQCYTFDTGNATVVYGSYLSSTTWHGQSYTKTTNFSTPPWNAFNGFSNGQVVWLVDVYMNFPSGFNYTTYSVQFQVYSHPDNGWFLGPRVFRYSAVDLGGTEYQYADNWYGSSGAVPTGVQTITRMETPTIVHSLRFQFMYPGDPVDFDAGQITVCDGTGPTSTPSPTPTHTMTPTPTLTPTGTLVAGQSFSTIDVRPLCTSTPAGSTITPTRNWLGPTYTLAPSVTPLASVTPGGPTAAPTFVPWDTVTPLPTYTGCRLPNDIGSHGPIADVGFTDYVQDGGHDKEDCYTVVPDVTVTGAGFTIMSAILPSVFASDPTTIINQTDICFKYRILRITLLGIDMMPFVSGIIAFTMALTVIGTFRRSP